MRPKNSLFKPCNKFEGFPVNVSKLQKEFLQRNNHKIAFRSETLSFFFSSFALARSRNLFLKLLKRVIPRSVGRVKDKKNCLLTSTGLICCASLVL